MIVGIIPAAGKGKRLGDLAFSKELLPIFEGNDLTSIDYLLSSFSENNVDQTLLVINRNKSDIIRYLGQSDKKTDNLLIKIMDSPSLPHSLFSFSSIISQYSKPGIIVFGLPDTIWKPKLAFSQITNSLKENKYDVCLGLFNSKPSNFFDSVKISNHKISSILVKKSPPLSEWFWGVGAMTFKSYIYLAKELAKLESNNSELLLGEFLNNQINKGNLNVGGVKLNNNSYHDLGTPTGFKSFILENQ